MNEMKMADTVKNNNTGPGIERKKRERRNDFPPEAEDQSKLAELISLWWLDFHLAERSANFKGHTAMPANTPTPELHKGETRLQRKDGWRER